jgi:hypothetical protein
MPAARQNRSKLADTSSQALPTAPIFVEGNTVGVVLILFMALLSFRGISTASLSAQGEQRCFSYFNIDRDNSWDQRLATERPGASSDTARLQCIMIGEITEKRVGFSSLMAPRQPVPDGRNELPSFSRRRFAGPRPAGGRARVKAF